MKHVDEAICTSIRKSNERRKRGAFFLGFSQSPVNFIDALIESQGKDFKVALGEPISPEHLTSLEQFTSQVYHMRKQKIRLWKKVLIAVKIRI
ncbi:hypothetical protein Tco_1061562 [Tanacetum coccineum]